ncbi:hypothetical protein C480_19147 [Natrialba aegyptia DSM 13077]|uniref:Uncharacterized protein n=1 Tax=Natrialba aegyptia DSM 13077 TaxID=1227491 RepID=M0APJ8_9EURY|nr:hypothetical protein C480_19147 [Natrialba aegyptia DSM 13077]
MFADNQISDGESSIRSTDTSHLLNDIVGMLDVMERQTANNNVKRVSRTRNSLSITPDEGDVLCFAISLLLLSDLEWGFC